MPKEKDRPPGHFIFPPGWSPCQPGAPRRGIGGGSGFPARVRARKRNCPGQSRGGHPLESWGGGCRGWPGSFGRRSPDRVRGVLWSVCSGGLGGRGRVAAVRPGEGGWREGRGAPKGAAGPRARLQRGNRTNEASRTFPKCQGLGKHGANRKGPGGNGEPYNQSLERGGRSGTVVSVDGRPVRLQLCDTAGQDEFDKLRPLCYTNTDIFLLCFSVVSPSSFQNVSEKWVPEIRCHCPKAPIILVGTQSDLREDVKILIELDKCKEKPVPEEAAKLCAEEIKAASYIECSALTQKNLKEVFDAAIVAGIQYSDTQQQPKKSKSRTPDKMKNLSKSWWKKYCCFV
ncbi:PREDICTED: rho-related GTP-binding protein RhoU [Colobus angolensis palliatus]|uniref:rho-related GTP-binding protein RhoU n=1 Tax=Colobus angolensis palliatus TaxID=336983 RepID=UPI0005F56252|nr:PREDICTED: rho-related GTP-binding protein RhoU [Colobus angolensis palliatus]